MLVDLVAVNTADGVRLDGAWQPPAEPAKGDLAVDAALLLHGAGSNFYGSTLMARLAEGLQQAGIGALRVNTRGHDAVSTSGGRRLGAGYEVVDECRHDISAWLAWLGEQGYRRIALVGHSLGAIKVVYASAKQPSPTVAAIVAASPPRLSYQAFRHSEASAGFFDAIAMAEQLVAEGEPDRLIEVRFPLPLLITAAGYVDKYGREERYNILPLASQLPAPALFTYGSEELAGGGIAFAGMDDALRSAAAKASSPLEVAILPNADHFYTGQHAPLANTITNWLQGKHFAP